MRKLGNNKMNKTGAGARPVVVADAVPVGESHQVVNGRDKEPQIPFWELINSLGDKWATDGYTAYIYRKWPIIDKGATDHFIGKMKEKFDPDYLLQTFGSGKYSLQLNDGQGRVASWKVESVHHPDHPPRLNPAEVTRDPQNDQYWAVWGKAGAAGKTASTDNSGEKEQSAFVKSMLARAGSFDPALGAMWEKTAKERDTLSAALAAKNAPPDMLELIKGIKELLPPQQAAAPAEKTELLHIIAALKGMQQAPPDTLAVLKQAKELFAPTKAERGADSQPASPLGGVKEMLGVITNVRDLFKSDAPAAANPAVVASDGSWQSVAAAGLQSLPATLQGLAALYAVFRGGPPPAGSTNMAPVAARPPAAAFDPYSNPGAARAYAQVQNAAAPAAAAPPSGTPPQPQPQPGPVPPPPAPNGPEDASQQGADSAMEQQMGGLLMSAINCLQRGIDGAMFADSIITLHGELEYEALVTNLQTIGIPMVIALAKGMPQAGPYISKYEPQFTRFLSQFLAGPEAPEDGTEEDDGIVDGAEAGTARLKQEAVA